MIQLDSLRNAVGQQGRDGIPSRQSIDSSDSSSSCVSSPGSVAYHSLPPAHVHPGDARNNVMVTWNQGGVPYPPPEVNSEDEDEYRPFTPPPPRERLSYTRYQLELLNAIYGTVKYPNSTQKQLIAKRVGITRDQVKIWFQNRRRKDVVGKNDKEPDKKDGDGEAKSDSPNSSNSDKEIVTVNTEEQSLDNTDNTDNPEESVLPPLVMKSVLAELIRFEKDPLKNKKKKKSRKRPASSQAAGPKPPQPMFHAYDMISPPNKITPSAFLNTASNRFNHSKISSAFHNPRIPRMPGPMMLTGQPPFLAGIPQLPSASSIGVLPNDYINPPNTTVAQATTPTSGHSLYDSIPVLADLLGYKAHADVTRQREHALSEAQLSSSQCSTIPTNRSDSCLLDPSTHSSANALGINRVFPFPFLAEAPVMLSSIRHSDPYRPQMVHYQPPSYSEDPYQALVISSLSNPYFSSTSPASWTSQSPSDSSVGQSPYSQL